MIWILKKTDRICFFEFIDITDIKISEEPLVTVKIKNKKRSAEKCLKKRGKIKYIMSLGSSLVDLQGFQHFPISSILTSHLSVLAE